MPDGPWTKYQKQVPAQGPWTKYAKPQPAQNIPAFIPAHQPIMNDEQLNDANAWGAGVRAGLSGYSTEAQRQEAVKDYATQPQVQSFADVLNTLNTAAEIPGQTIGTLTRPIPVVSDVVQATAKPYEWLNTGFEKLLPDTPTGKALARTFTNAAAYAMPEIIKGTKFGEYAAKGLDELGKRRTTGQLEKATTETKRVAPALRKELNYDQANAVWQQYMNRALKNDPNAIDRSSPETAMRQVTDLTNEQMHGLWNQLDKVNSQFGDAKIINGDLVKRDAVANASSNRYAAQMKPEQIAATKAFVDQLPKQMSPTEAAEYIKGLNADLDGFYKKTPGEQSTIESKYGGVAGLKAVRDALAKEYFNKLESFGQKGIEAARRDYGALSQMHTALERNITRAEKPSNPIGIHRTGPAVVGEILGGTIGGPLGGPVGMAAGYGLGAYFKNRYAPNATILRAIGRIAKYGAEPTDIPDFEPSVRGYLTPGATRLPAQYPNETGGPVDVREGLGGSGMAPGLLPERTSPAASTPPPGGSFYEPGQKFVEGGTQPRGTTVWNDIYQMPDELRTYAGIKALREQMVQWGIPKKEVYQMQLPELWSEFLKRNRERFGDQDAPVETGLTPEYRNKNVGAQKEATEKTIENLKRRRITRKQQSEK